MAFTDKFRGALCANFTYQERMILFSLVHTYHRDRHRVAFSCPVNTRLHELICPNSF